LRWIIPSFHPLPKFCAFVIFQVFFYVFFFFLSACNAPLFPAHPDSDFFSQSPPPSPPGFLFFQFLILMPPVWVPGSGSPFFFPLPVFPPLAVPYLTRSAWLAVFFSFSPPRFFPHGRRISFPRKLPLCPPFFPLFPPPLDLFCSRSVKINRGSFFAPSITPTAFFVLDLLTNRSLLRVPQSLPFPPPLYSVPSYKLTWSLLWYCSLGRPMYFLPGVSLHPCLVFFSVSLSVSPAQLHFAL